MNTRSARVPNRAQAVQHVDSNALAIQALTARIRDSTPRLLQISKDDESVTNSLGYLLKNLQASNASIAVLRNDLISGREGRVVGDFINFAKLPVELRIKIWRLLLPGPRIVEVIHRVTDTGFKIRPGIPPPVLLHVCHEVRQIALKKYRMWLDNPQFNGCHIRIDPINDTILAAVLLKLGFWDTEQGRLFPERRWSLFGM
jgi:hypothetical protein